MLYFSTQSNISYSSEHFSILSSSLPVNKFLFYLLIYSNIAHKHDLMTHKPCKATGRKRTNWSYFRACRNDGSLRLDWRTCWLSGLHWPPYSPDLKLTEHLGCARAGESQNAGATDNGSEMIRCNHANVVQNLKGMFPGNWEYDLVFLAFQDICLLIIAWR